MTKYMNLSGNSNVEAYEIGEDHITVKFFGTWRTYTYSYYSAGRENVEKAKGLAKQGQGLNSFIMREMKYDYEN